jgi:hypothetical protein
VSTILDALRKLQRERAAQSPAPDLRGSITTETPRGYRGRHADAVSRRIAAALVLLGVVGGGYGLYRSGLLARFSPGDEAAEQALAEAELAVVEREVALRDAAAARLAPDPQAEAVGSPAPIAANLSARGAPPERPPTLPQSESPDAATQTARADTPEILAERARLEAARVNERAALEAQRRAELDAAALQAAVNPPPSAPAIPIPPLAVSPPSGKPAVAARPKRVAPVVAAKPKPAAATPATGPTPQRNAEPAPPPSVFPEVRVESIRWYPAADRRVASLRFEQQDVPEAHEGDIVAGVLVYRIDPGSVELRVGSAQRTVSPGP